jgi:hypothetical protein
MVNYSAGIIYKIVCVDTEITDCYIGSTCSFKARKCAHKSTCHNIIGRDYNKNVYQFIRLNGGWDNWSMIQLEAYEATDKRQLETRERYYIDLLKPSLNKNIPSRNKKNYKTEKKIEIAIKSKIYKNKNKVEIDEKNKIYRDLNKDKLQKYRTENRNKINKIQNEIYQLNKDKKNEQQRNRRFNNKLENFILS